MSIHEQLRERIPFLREIPDPIYFNLDTSEFFLPDYDTGRAREDLENVLGHHVMTYKRDIFRLDIPPEKHLCANIKPAKLTEDQLEILRSFEDKYNPRGVSFVVYHKPLTLTKPTASALYEFYSERGLTRV